MAAALFNDLPTSLVITNPGIDPVTISRVGVIAAGANRTVNLATRLESKRLLIWKAIKSAVEAGTVEFVSGADASTGSKRYNNASGADVVVDGITFPDGDDTDVHFDSYNAGERNRKYKMLLKALDAGYLTEVSYTAEDPSIDTVTPAVVSALGGDTITITGSNFVDGATVTVDGNPATDVEVVDDNTITCTVPEGPDAPAGTATAVDVVVTNPSTETDTAAAALTYGPVLTSIVPNSGPSAGGTAVVLNGLGFQAGAQVTVDSVAVVEGVITSTTIAFNTPAGNAGAQPKDVRVVNPDGSEFTAALFTYV
jgi:hypothetical protein